MSAAAAEPVTLKKGRLMPPQPAAYECNAEELAKVEEFRQTVFAGLVTEGLMIKRWVPLTPEDQSIVCAKFLVARKFDKEKATEMLRGYCIFARDRQIEETAYFPSCFPIRGYDQEAVGAMFGQTGPRVPGDVERIHKNINPFYRCTYHKWDKVGHPVLYEATGATNVVPLVERCKMLTKIGEKYTAPIVDYHVHFNEMGARLVRYNDQTVGREIGQRILGVVVIMDAQGLGYGTLYSPALELFKASMAIDQQYYPEGLHRLFVINCPTMVAFAYNIVKGWIDPRVQSKIEFLKPHETGPRLLEWIDADKLPSFIGGTCNCEGGCMYTPPDSDMKHDESDPLSELITITAGSKIDKTIEADVSEAVSYEFSVEDKNVMFSAVFTGVDGTVIEVFSAAKAQEGSDRFVFPSKGKLVFTWSNEHSWLRSKSVSLRVMKMPST